MINRYRVHIIVLFIFLALGSISLLPRLNYGFDFQQFFPENDPDLDFYLEFIEEFEPDNNFLLVALVNPGDSFNLDFFKRYHKIALESRSLTGIIQSHSLSQILMPVKTPFGYTAKPLINLSSQQKFEKDLQKVITDERWSGQWVDTVSQSVLLVLKTVDYISLEDSDSLISELDEKIKSNGFNEYHLLGSPFFQTELVRMEKNELSLFTILSGLLVSLIIFFIYRKAMIVGIVLISILMCLLLFLGFLGVTGRELNVLAAFYPILLLIVGTSDVVHILTKFLDELKKGLGKKEAMRIAIRQIGLATLFTSLTTAVGFGSLLTSRLGTIQDFGLNAALGVILAFIVVISFTTAVLLGLNTKTLTATPAFDERVNQYMYKIHQWTINKPGLILLVSAFILSLAGYGISQITTNYKIEDTLPRNSRVLNDFVFFEENYAGFRPFEIAVFPSEGKSVTDLDVLGEMQKLENHLQETGKIGNLNSLVGIFKAIQQIRMPSSSATELNNDPAAHEKNLKLFEKFPKGVSVLVNDQRDKTRISAKIIDVGADSIKILSQSIDQWISENINPEIVQFKQTGTGLILDKNAEYITGSLIRGLGGALLIISVLMTFLFKNIRLLIIALIPNVIPLIISAGIIGLVGIELDAMISIVFAIAFGIAVDDTIHFLSKFKLTRDQGYSIEESLEQTFRVTGKAIFYTTIILLFGFLILTISSYPPVGFLGILIGITLITALLADLFVLPILLRKLL